MTDLNGNSRIQYLRGKITLLRVIVILRKWKWESFKRSHSHSFCWDLTQVLTSGEMRCECHISAVLSGTIRKWKPTSKSPSSPLTLILWERQLTWQKAKNSEKTVQCRFKTKNMLWKRSSFKVRSDRYPANSYKSEVIYTSQHSDDKPYEKSMVKPSRCQKINNQALEKNSKESLVGQKHSSAPNSHHWLSQCCCVALVGNLKQTSGVLKASFQRIHLPMAYI